MILVLNILWFIFGGGLLVWILWVLLGCLLYITIIGIPFGIAAFRIAGFAHFRLAGVNFAPLGKKSIPK
ncbi:MAG: hypothetical protein H8D87_01475 [Deltaproteobacteria bacterium]|uniref:YccF domain-containing protein n=1 Tax=Desulfobacula sp. TaxID=2593537 RepID=UPI0019945A9E|nr:hypothetical protein [Candidatus Desulfobacula maris]MBL6994843.1 hypothetical protein [Desulfobacula sp.]